MNWNLASVTGSRHYDGGDLATPIDCKKKIRSSAAAAIALSQIINVPSGKLIGLKRLFPHVVKSGIENQVGD